MKYLFSVILALAFSLVDASAQKKVKVVELDGTKSLAEVLGDEKLEIDSLVIKGKLMHSDFPTIRESSKSGRLLGLNMYDCDVENDSIPAQGLNIAKKSGWHYGKDCIHHLTSITLPKNLRAVGPYGLAYNHCSKIELPSTLRVIDDYAFSEWQLPQGKLVIPDGVERIGICAFYNFSCINEITIPPSVREIGKLAFKSNSAVRIINFSEGNLEKIGEDAFEGVYISELVIPSTVTEIGAMAFYCTDGLERLVLPPHLKVLKYRTFCYSQPTSVTWPEDLELMEYEAVDNFSGDSLILPDPLREIQKDNFVSAGNARLIVMPRNLSKLEGNIFCRVANLKEMYAKNPVPPELPDDFDAGSCLTNLSSDAVLYVPTGSVDAYKANAFFGKFKIIKESDKYPTGINKVSDNTNAETGQGKTIYNLNGQAVERPVKGHLYIRDGKKFIAK